MDIINKGKVPIRIPLPGGKKLHLGLGKAAQISPKAAEHPPVKKLIEEGAIEIVGGGRSKGAGPAAGRPGVGPGQSGPSAGGVRHTGDR